MLNLTYKYDIYWTNFEKRWLPSACDKSCLETVHSLQGETWRIGKGKHPCTAWESKLWPHAAPEQRTSHRYACGPARHQLKSAHASEKHGFVVFPASSYALPACLYSTALALEHISCVRWQLCGCEVPCTAPQCISTSSCASAVRVLPPPWAPGTCVPVLVMCGS